MRSVPARLTTFATAVSLIFVANSSAAPIPQSVRVSKETTHLTEPLHADGTVNYAAALNQMMSKGVTPENNAAVVLRRMFGDRELGAEFAAEYFQKLGIKPVGSAGVFVTMHDANPGASNDAVAEAWKQATARPWSADENPLMASWIKANRPALQQLHEAASRSRYFTPLVPEDGPLVAALLPDAQNSRAGARLLIVDAMHRLHTGDVKGAWRNIETCRQLGHHVASGATLIESLVGHALHNMAYEAEAQFLSHAGLSAAELAALRAEYAERRELTPMFDKVDRAERFMFLDCVSGIRKGTPLSAFTVGRTTEGRTEQLLQRVVLNTTVDFEAIMVRGNKWYDEMVQAAATDGAAARWAAVAALTAETEQQVSSSREFDLFDVFGAGPSVTERFGGMLLGLLTPALEACVRVEARAAARRQMGLLAVALAEHKAEHGRYPATLTDLNASNAVAPDPLSGKPLVYRRMDDGCILYSVGTDGVDSGGRTFEEDSASDDQVVRLQ